jgi:hypothetical protein
MSDKLIVTFHENGVPNADNVQSFAPSNYMISKQQSVEKTAVREVLEGSFDPDDFELNRGTIESRYE